MSSTYPIGFPTKLASWKGRSFYQVVASIQKNQKNASKLSVNQLCKALPLSIYRREIHNIPGQTAPKNCNARVSVKISDFETPGNNLVSYNAPTLSNGLANTLDLSPTTISAERGACNGPNVCVFSPQDNARKRCRSAGMIPRKFNTARNNDTYSSSTQQYLTSRNMTIKQNDYVYIRKGNSGLVPGPGAASNIYSPAGLSHCVKPKISAANNNNSFSYVWVDGTVYSAFIPDGYYDIDSLNQAFQAVQIINNTYIVETATSRKIFLLNISYDNQTQSVIVYAGVASKATYPASTYSSPGTWLITNLPNTDPTPLPPSPSYTNGATYFIVPNNTNFSVLIGFGAGTYFGGINMTGFPSQIPYSYVPLYYKPNNQKFAVQGAVDSSTLLQRTRYNTITDAAGGIRSVYGSAAAAAIAYGVSEKAYTIKTRVGDKPIDTPVINPRTGQVCRKNFIYRM